MNKLLTGGLCASLMVGLTACTNQSADIKALDTNKTETAAAVSKVLSSGINFANFDKSVRPQDDFYSYVNGTWFNNTQIPSDRTSTGAFYDLRDKSRNDVRHIIEEVAANTKLTAGSDEQKVADLYRSFMDTETLNKLGTAPIEAELNKIDALQTKDALVNYFAHSQIIGSDTPLGFYIDVDAKDSSRYATHIWQYGLSLPEKDYYFNEGERFVNIRKAYLKHIETMFTLADFSSPKVSAEQVLALETAIASKHWDVVETRDSTKTYNLMTIKELTTLAPDINWAGYLNTLGVEKQQDIIINQPSFIKGFNDVFKANELTTWQAYMKWKLLTHFARKMSANFDDEHFEFFFKTLNGQAEAEPRWKRGVNTVNNILGEVVGKVYVKRHFAPEAKIRMQTLVENLRGAYGESINDLNWMSADTKIAAREKLAKFDPKIGYPDRWENYDKLAIKADDLVGNNIRANELNHEKELEKLAGPIRKWEWHMTPQTVNAYYNPTMNEIVFPAAILQAPFFNMDADDAVNYGGIGAVIGHEMGHGFDDQGAKFDGEGNMRDWWTENDLSEFSARGSALVAQYNSYAVFDDLHVNGELTLGENIGDLSGVTIAYKAYKKSLNGKEAPIIDGLTGDERFFIGFTQIWRAKIKEKTMRNRIATDPHSPAKFRSLGALSNMPQFYSTFNVKEGDAMYIAPAERVKIW